MPSRQEPSLAMESESNGEGTPLLQRIRHMWQFANLCQWIYIFGKAAKIDESLEIDEIEHECMKPSSTVLSDIGLALLKLISSHRGLTHDIFDEQLRKQYLANAPENNPLGDGEEESLSFSDLDVLTKITVLQQLTQWAMVYPERLREKMDEQKDTDQTSWRIEPYGWDAQDRTYYVLDDNRVYRLSEPPAAPASKPKPKMKKTYGSSRRSSKRRRAVSDAADESETKDDNDTEKTTPGSKYGQMIWECVAITLEDVRLLINSLRKTRDGNEKILRDQLEVHLLPILEKQEESRKRKQERHEREMLSLAKMANAKRSSRIAHKVEQQKQDEKDKEEQEKMLREAQEERRAEQKRLKLERERDFRMFSREKRLKERETRRRLHQEELSQLSEDGKAGSDSTARVSERHLQQEIERNKQALKELDDEEEDWIFDCICGLYGQVDDGAHSIACERCNVWQHSKCVNIEETEADRPDFQFICASCKRRIAEANTPRKTIKLKIKGPSEMAADKQKIAQSAHAVEQPITPSTWTAVTKEIVAAERPVALPSPAFSSHPSIRHEATANAPVPSETGRNGGSLAVYEPQPGSSFSGFPVAARVPPIPELPVASKPANTVTEQTFKVAHTPQSSQPHESLHNKAPADHSTPAIAHPIQSTVAAQPQQPFHTLQRHHSEDTNSNNATRPSYAPHGRQTDAPYVGHANDTIQMHRELPPLHPPSRPGHVVQPNPDFALRQLPHLHPPRKMLQTESPPPNLSSQPTVGPTLPPISSFSTRPIDTSAAQSDASEKPESKPVLNGRDSQQS